MKARSTPLLVFALAIAVPLLGLSQTPSRSEQQDEKIVIGTAEVTLDMVVRDKKGRPVKDLTASVFEIYEDGVRQQIESFRLVVRESGSQRGAAATEEASSSSARAAAPRVTKPRDPFAGIGIVAFVFDRLSPDARARARSAGLSYLSDGLRTDDFAGVFAIDLSLRALQPFTNNVQLVRQAVDRAGSQSSAAFASVSEEIRGLSVKAGQLDSSAAASEAAASAGGQGNDVTAQGNAAMAARLEQTLVEMTKRSLEQFEVLHNEQQGSATTNGLLALVNSLRTVPGRKAVIFFSEGLAISSAVQPYFRSVISTANRANVSIYAVDAAGLRVESVNDETRREIASLADQSLRNASRESTEGPRMRELERNEAVLLSNPQSGLGRLAQETGGFLISDTNNIASRLRQVSEDLNTYYALTYVPKNRNYDGRFRQIEVKLKRSGLDLQTRRGYYAINADYASPVLANEAPALAALSNNARRIEAFPVRAAGMSFPEQSRPGLVPVVVEVPRNAITYALDKEKKVYTTDLSIVVLIRDESKQVVSKLSRQYLLSVPPEKLEAAKRGEVLFYREADLAPGRYTIEAVAYDAPTGRASVHRASVEVPDSDETKLSMSSIVIIKRAEQLSVADQKATNPFRFGEIIVHPNLGEPLRNQASNPLAFFFTVYPSKGMVAIPKATVEVLQHGRGLGKTSAELTPPDARGSIQYAGTLPLDPFQPGVYELRITVAEGQSSTTRSQAFTIEP
ncbi:hypothetical protein BH18ACI4_BH18ACI4_20120 [soil metagenome]